MVLPTDDCDECSPAGLERRSHAASSAVIVSSLPFLITFLFVATLVFQKLYPMLSGQDGKLQLPKPSKPSNGFKIKRIAAFTFSTTIALAAVLAELILCEISDTMNAAARGVALKITIFLLLIMLIVVIPSLEIHSLISSAGWKYKGPDAGKLKLAWVFHIVAFGGWLLAFWYSGMIILGSSRGGWVNATTEHVGVIGISLMALLSGFASVSAPWQNLFAKQKFVSETTLARKQAGLDSTNDMLATKRSRLRALEQKMSKAPPESMLQKGMGMFRGSNDATEKKTLEMEISGLENMKVSLSTHHSLLSTRYQQQRLAQKPHGKLLRLGTIIFSCYCLYRIVTTSITFVRRRATSSPSTFVGSDPINNILALFVRAYDSQLDRAAWTRQISFFMSGVMLCASFTSVMQTFHFFSRYTPGLLKAVQANLALIVAQISATYVISVALLLRGIMPGELVTDRLKTLGGDEMGWVDGWFEQWFLGGVLVTVIGIFIGRNIGGVDEWDDDEDVEMGKMH